MTGDLKTIGLFSRLLGLSFPDELSVNDIPLLSDEWIERVNQHDYTCSIRSIDSQIIDLQVDSYMYSDCIYITLNYKEKFNQVINHGGVVLAIYKLKE